MLDGGGTNNSRGIQLNTPGLIITIHYILETMETGRRILHPGNVSIPFLRKEGIGHEFHAPAEKGCYKHFLTHKCTCRN